MIHLGDIKNINGAEIEPVDVITFGSPCQDLSVAGHREGLNGERSGLFMEAVRVIKEMREHGLEQIRSGRTDEPVRPRFAIWENVPGAFSSNRGEDFRVVLEELAHIIDPDIEIPRPLKKSGGVEKWTKSGLIIGDSWSIAWRTMDAQYWGVPQRRKRIALVMDFTDRCAGEILFEQEGLRGDHTQSIEPWKGIARNPADCVGESYTDESYTLKIRGGCDTYKDWNGQTRGAGKGALVQTERSATLGIHQDQTLFK